MRRLLTEIDIAIRQMDEAAPLMGTPEEKKRAWDFVKRVSAMGSIHPMFHDPTVMFPEGVMVTVKPTWHGWVYINILTFEEQRKKGVGSAVLKRITDLADKMGITLSGVVEPFGVGEKMSKAQLKKWYAKFGFKPEMGRGGDQLIRPPRQK